MLKLFLPTVFVVCALLTMALGAKTEPSPADYTRSQIENLPEDDIWWTKNGETMLWSFKNLHTIFPTVTVHRKGAVKELDTSIDENIGSIYIPTKDGDMRLIVFWTAMSQLRFLFLSFIKEGSFLSAPQE